VHNLFQNNIEPKILIAKSDWALTRCCWSFALEKHFWTRRHATADASAFAWCLPMQI